MKEKKAREHLDKTYNVVGELNLHKLKPNIKNRESKENKFNKERE